uniref:Fork-head domain-containing protein n=1 Tax=Macrostomum lignano TaxID=282301 RepID=A0A1I8FNE2_9PLAT
LSSEASASFLLKGPPPPQPGSRIYAPPQAAALPESRAIRPTTAPGRVTFLNDVQTLRALCGGAAACCAAAAGRCCRGRCCSLLLPRPKMCTLAEIYQFIMDLFLTTGRTSSAARTPSGTRCHTFNDCFHEGAAQPGQAGCKGSYWTLHPDSGNMFENGCYLRRQKRLQRSASGRQPGRPNRAATAVTTTRTARPTAADEGGTDAGISERAPTREEKGVSRSRTPAAAVKW